MNVDNLIEQQYSDLEISSDLTSISSTSNNIIIKETNNESNNESNKETNKFSNLIIKNIQYNNSNSKENVIFNDDNSLLDEENDNMLNNDSENEEINEFDFLLKGKNTTLDKLEELADEFSELEDMAPKITNYDKLEKLFEKQIINGKDTEKYKKEETENITYILKTYKDVEIALKRVCKSLNKQILKSCVKGWNSYHNMYNMNETKISEIISSNEINNKHCRVEIGIMYKQDNGWYNTFINNKYNMTETKVIGFEKDFIKKCIDPLINLQDGYKLRKNINSYNCRCEKKECVINNKKSDLVYYVKFKKNK